MPELSAFQDALCAALEGEAAALAPWCGSDGEPPGLSVYRNTVAKGAVDALAATYHTVELMVGEAWFGAAAALYARQNPPLQPSLLAYGADFPQWLAGFPPAQDTPYLAQVADLDRLWWEAYFAADAEPVAPDAFGALRADNIAQVRARLHPSARLAAFDHNVASLWLAHQPPQGPVESFELAETAEFVLVVRPVLDVEVRLLDPATHAFLSACAAGRSLLDAAELVLELHPEAQFSSVVATSLDAGAIARLESIPGGNNRHER